MLRLSSNVKRDVFLDNKHHSSRLFSHIRSECEDVCQSPTLNSGRKILQSLLKTIFLSLFSWSRNINIQIALFQWLN